MSVRSETRGRIRGVAPPPLSSKPPERATTTQPPGTSPDKVQFSKNAHFDLEKVTHSDSLDVTRLTGAGGDEYREIVCGV